LFERAFTLALETGQEFIAVDAAHMAALAAPGEKGLRAWTQRGLELATRSPGVSTRKRVATLYQNLGWLLLQSGNTSHAVVALERAVAARERDPARPRFAREMRLTPHGGAHPRLGCFLVHVRGLRNADRAGG
jgi:hypothetical protein